MEEGRSEDTQGVLRLNVGGCLYTARRQSLCHFKDSMLASMFGGRFPLKMDQSGACLIDRDGSLFKYLLDYLHGEVRIPEDEQIRAALQEEADYFGIPYPYSQSDHLANEMETYSLKSNIELKKVLLDFCDSYDLVCTKPTVWILHYLNTSGVSCESKIIGVYATRADGTDACYTALWYYKSLEGMRFLPALKRAGLYNNAHIEQTKKEKLEITSNTSVAELKKMLDAFDTWEGRGVSYWRVPQELIECWTLEECPLKGSLHQMPPVHKRRLIDFAEEEHYLPCKVGPKPIRFSGPSTSPQSKVKNSSSLRVAARSASPPAATVKQPSGGSLTLQEAAPEAVPARSHHAQVPSGSADLGAPRRALPRKPESNRVVKLKRTPLFVTPPQPPSPTCSETNRKGCAAADTPAASAALSRKGPAPLAGSFKLKNKKVDG